MPGSDQVHGLKFQHGPKFRKLLKGLLGHIALRERQELHIVMGLLYDGTQSLTREDQPVGLQPLQRRADADPAGAEHLAQLLFRRKPFSRRPVPGHDLFQQLIINLIADQQLTRNILHCYFLYSSFPALFGSLRKNYITCNTSWTMSHCSVFSIEYLLILPVILVIVPVSAGLLLFKLSGFETKNTKILLTKPKKSDIILLYT